MLNRRRLSAILILLLCWGEAAQGGIVIAARKPEDQPRLVLNTGGPTTDTRVLSFSPDGRRLYSAGMDKSVSVWDLRGELRGIRRTAAQAPILAQQLRWEIARGPRGAIYAMSASPIDPRVAVGGLSARDANGDIVLIDSGTGQVAATLRAHRRVVVSVDFSPNGRRLVSVSEEGDIRVWDLPAWEAPQVRGIIRAKAPPVLAAEPLPLSLNSMQLRPGQGKDFSYYPQPAVFLSDNLIAVALTDRERSNQWRIGLVDLSKPDRPTRLLPVVHQGKVASIARSPDSSRWASADTRGTTYVFVDHDAERSTTLSCPHVVYSLSFGPKGRLLVTTERDQKGQAHAQLYDAINNSLLDTTVIGAINNGFAGAISPDGSRAAVAGAGQHEVLLFALKDRNGADLEKPLSKPSLSRLRGGGELLARVAFAKDGSYKLALFSDIKAYASPTGNVAPNIAPKQIFDVGQPAIVPHDQAAGPWREPNDNSDGWAVALKGTSVDLVKGERKKTLKLHESQGRARTFCFVPGPGGAARAIAISTDGDNGIYLYDLTSDDSFSLLRYFRDHVGFPTSLSANRDGTFLASGSMDETAKVWSLEGIGRQNPTDTLPIWGARFERQADGVVLTEMVEAGIVSHRGLRRGDQIVEATFPSVVARGLGQADEPLTTRDPDLILRGIQTQPVREAVVFTIRRSGRALNQRILLVPGWEPLATLFIDRRGEWAFWTPQGFYDSSPNGDELFGWQLNRGVGRRPDFFRADQFRRQLERPSVMRGLLSNRSLPAALRQANENVAGELDRVIKREADRTPVVEILSPRDGERLAGQQGVQVVARIRYPDPATARQADVRALVNGVPAPVGAIDVDGNEAAITWQVQPADVYSRVRVLVDGEAAKPSANVSFADVHLRAEPGPSRRRPKLYLLAMAAGDYRGNLVPPLRYTLDDAKGIVETLRSSAAPLYDVQEPKLLFNQDISPKALRQELDRLAKEMKDAQSDDLLVVFLAGHGWAIDEGAGYYFIPPAERLATADAASAKSVVQEIGISWEELRKVRSLPCRKLFLLDTCYSGNILLRETRAASAKAQIRPLSRDEILVVAATSVNQLAGETARLGHGIFTQCLLDGLAGQADQRGDRTVQLDELARFVETKVAEITGRNQVPSSTPNDLFNLVAIPLATYQ